MSEPGPGLGPGLLPVIDDLVLRTPRVCVFPLPSLRRNLAPRPELRPLSQPGPPCAVWAPAPPQPYPPWLRAVPAGPGADLHVGRLRRAGGNLLPCGVSVSGACVAWQRSEILVVLRGSVDWVPAADGDVPAYAFPAGLTADGQALYSARATEGDTVVPGWVLPGDKDGCHVVWQDGSERVFWKYDVLSLS